MFGFIFSYFVSILYLQYAFTKHNLSHFFKNEDCIVRYSLLKTVLEKTVHLRVEIFVVFYKKQYTMPNYKSLKRMNKVERLRTTEKLLLLRKQLGDEIPPKTATDTLLLATWNIRKFADNRTLESLYYIAEIINRFDLIAIQEISANMKGLVKLMSLLHKWDYLVTDATDGSAGGGCGIGGSSIALGAGRVSAGEVVFACV
jgi:hypothetical protein